MGCLIGLLGLAMAIGGGIGWFTSGAFLWWGLVCVIGILILFVCACAAGAGGDFADGLGDMGDFGGSD